jgi:hypothetical protein
VAVGGPPTAPSVIEYGAAGGREVVVINGGFFAAFPRFHPRRLADRQIPGWK